MNIKYVEEGTGILNKYLKFRLNFIIDFVSILLPIKIGNDKSIRAKLYNYYILSKFEKLNFNELINNSNSTLKKIFEFNNISINEVQYICFCLIDTNTLLEWKEKPITNEEIRYRKSLIDLATTIYIAMQYEKNVFLNLKESLSFDDINKKVINNLKGIIDIEILIGLNEKKKRIEKLFVDINKSNKTFVDKMSDYGLFKSQVFKINNKISPLYLSHLCCNFNEFKDENKKEIDKISKRENIQTSMKKIEIDIISLFVGLSILKENGIKVIIELNSGFLSNKNNYLSLFKKLDVIKKYILISIPKNAFVKYNDYIEELRKKDYNVIVSYEEFSNDKELIEILRKTKYLLLKYFDNEELGKLLSKCKENDVVPIVLNVKNANCISKYGLEYYTLNQG